MFLLYVDESGNPLNKDERHFVMAGLAVYENQAFYLSKNFDELQDKWFPEATTTIEFHASDMRTGRSNPWKGLSREVKENILYDACEAITNISDKGLYLFGVVIEKECFPKDDPIEKCYYELCGHFDKFIDQSNLDGGDRNRGLIILDSSRYRGHLDILLNEYRQFGGTKFGRVRNFADAPTFADSKATRLLQAADLVSYSIYRRYEYGDARLFDRLINRFQRSNNIIHGLVHLVSKRKRCVCPACLSRQSMIAPIK